MDYEKGLADEEDKGKQLAKVKAKQEAIIADLEDQISRGEKVTSLFESLVVTLFLFCDFIGSGTKHRRSPRKITPLLIQRYSKILLYSLTYIEIQNKY